MSKSDFFFAEIVFFSGMGCFLLCFLFAQTHWEDWKCLLIIQLKNATRQSNQ